MAHDSASSSYGTLKKVRLWSEEKHVDWKLDLSKMRANDELRNLIAAQFNRAVGMALLEQLFLIHDWVLEYVVHV